MSKLKLGNLATLQHCRITTLQLGNFATLQLCNFATCNLHNAMCKNTPSLRQKGRGPTLWVEWSLTLGVRGGECPAIPLVLWKGVALPRQRSSRTFSVLDDLLMTLSNFKSFYSLLSAFVRFLNLRDFLFFFKSMFERLPKLSFRDFLDKSLNWFLNACSRDFFD